MITIAQSWVARCRDNFTTTSSTVVLVANSDTSAMLDYLNGKWQVY